MLPSMHTGRASLGRWLARYRPQNAHIRSNLESKRHSSAKPPVFSKADTNVATKSIPGPTWLWSEPLGSYTRMHMRRPHTVQLVSTLVVYFIGDLTAQTLAPTPQEEDNGTTAKKTSTYDPYRTVRALIIGGLAAIPGYHWFLFLARNFNYSSKVGSIVLKVMINQVIFTPIFNSYFFGMQSLLTGAGWNDIVQRIKHTVPQSWMNSWKIWPAVTAFSFAFIRVELRGLFAGVIAIGWQTYLSVLNQRAAKVEKEKKLGSNIDQTKALQHA